MVLNFASQADATGRRASLYDEIDDEGVKDTDGPVLAEPSVDADKRTAFWGAPRAPMTLALSDDDGRSWPIAHDIENGDGYCMSNNSREGLNRELSYPSVLAGADGELNIAYTWHRKTIKHVRYDAAALQAIRAARPTSAGPDISAAATD